MQVDPHEFLKTVLGHIQNIGAHPRRDTCFVDKKIQSIKSAAHLANQPFAIRLRSNVRRKILRPDAGVRQRSYHVVT